MKEYPWSSTYRIHRGIHGNGTLPKSMAGNFFLKIFKIKIDLRLFFHDTIGVGKLQSWKGLATHLNRATVLVWTS